MEYNSAIKNNEYILIHDTTWKHGWNSKAGAKWKNLYTNEYILYDSIYMKFLEKTNL